MLPTSQFHRLARNRWWACIICLSASLLEGDSQGDLLSLERKSGVFINYYVWLKPRYFCSVKWIIYENIMIIFWNLENVEQTFQISHNLLCVIVLMNLSQNIFICLPARDSQFVYQPCFLARRNHLLQKEAEITVLVFPRFLYDKAACFSHSEMLLIQ